MFSRKNLNTLIASCAVVLTVTVRGYRMKSKYLPSPVPRLCLVPKTRYTYVCVNGRYARDVSTAISFGGEDKWYVLVRRRILRTVFSNSAKKKFINFIITIITYARRQVGGDIMCNGVRLSGGLQERRGDDEGDETSRRIVMSVVITG